MSRKHTIMKMGSSKMLIGIYLAMIARIGAMTTNGRSILEVSEQNSIFFLSLLYDGSSVSSEGSVLLLRLPPRTNRMSGTATPPNWLTADVKAVSYTHLTLPTKRIV